LSSHRVGKGLEGPSSQQERAFQGEDGFIPIPKRQAPEIATESEPEILCKREPRPDSYEAQARKLLKNVLSEGKVGEDEQKSLSQ
jgi:hypothetical protein